MKFFYKIVIVLIIALCAGAFYLGMQKSSNIEPLEPPVNEVYDISGKISINTSQSIQARGFVDGIELLSQTEVSNKAEWKFNANFNGNEELVISVKIKNVSSNEIGAYFYSGNELNNGLATRASIKKIAEIKDNNNTALNPEDDFVVATANLSPYSHIMPPNDNFWANEVELVARVKMGQNFKAGKTSELNLTINIEEYIPNVTTEVLEPQHNELNFIKLSSSYISSGVKIDRTAIFEKAGFKNLNSLNGFMLIMPCTVGIIGPNAFENCTALEEIFLPSGVSSVGDMAFVGCQSLTNLTIDENNYMYSDGDCNAIIEKTSQTLLVATSHTVIPEGIKVIGQYAFTNIVNLTKVNIPASVVQIGKNAFDGCYNLQEIAVVAGNGQLQPYTLPTFENGELVFVSWFTSKAYKLSDRAIEIVDNNNNVTYYTRWAKNVGAINLNFLGQSANVVGTINNTELLNQKIEENYVWEIDPATLQGKEIQIQLEIENETQNEVGAYFFSGEGLSGNKATLSSIKTQEEINNYENAVGSASLTTYSHMMPANNPEANKITMLINIKLNDCFEEDNYYLLNYTLNLEQYVANVTTASVLSTQKNINFIKLSSSYMSAAKLTTRQSVSLSTGFNGKTSPEDIIVVLPNTIKKINESAFEGCEALTNINMPMLVQTIGDKAFKDCSNLKGVEFLNNLTIIGNYAFQNSSTIKALRLPRNLQSIGYSAFNGCEAIESVSIFENIKSVGSYAFKGIQETAFNEYAGVHYLGNKNNPYVIALKLYDENLGALNINPNTLVIANQAFYNSDITSVYTGLGVKYIGSNAFYNCAQISTLTLGGSVQEIGSYAFYNCLKFTQLSLPPNLKTISEYAFEKCSKIISLIVPSSVVTIGSGVFRNCESISNIITIPSSITTIPAEIFKGCSNLKGVLFGAGVTSIGKNAFAECESLEQMTLPNNLKTIGESAFSNCKSLEGALNIPATVTTIGKAAFLNCVGFTGQINIPNPITLVESNAFQGCTGLSEVLMLGNVKEIKAGAFSGCKNITNVLIPASVTTIGDNAFNNCSNLINITIGEKVTSIGKNAFNGVPESNFIVYNGAKYLGNEQNQYHALIKVSGSDVTDCTTHENTKVIAGYAFEASNLAKVTITASVYNVGAGAFSSSDKLASVVIGNGVKIISEGAFQYCTALKSITIPNSITQIKSSLFSGCLSLESVLIGSGVTVIESSAFQSCMSLTKIDLPSTVTEIGSKAFAYCSNLKRLTIGNKLSKIGSDAFNGCPNEMFTIVGGVKYLGSQSNAYHALIKADVALTNATVNSKTYLIAGGAFAGCTKLTAVTIPQSVKGIGASAFSGCGKLSSVNIAEGITSIESKTFENCSSLKTISIPKSVTKIKAQAFSGATSLSGEIVLSNNIQQIGGEAFAYSKITSLIIGTGVTTIADYAFNYCDKMVSVTFLSDTPPATIGVYAFGSGTDIKNIYVNNPSALAAYKQVKNLARYESLFVVK